MTPFSRATIQAKTAYEVGQLRVPSINANATATLDRNFLVPGSNEWTYADEIPRADIVRPLYGELESSDELLLRPSIAYSVPGRKIKNFRLSVLRLWLDFHNLRGDSDKALCKSGSQWLADQLPYNDSVIPQVLLSVASSYPFRGR